MRAETNQLLPGDVHQAGVIAIRREASGVQVCLIRTKGKWGIPKGFIDPGDSSQQAALNEAFEEAGLRGEIIGDAVGRYDYEKWTARLTVVVYVMRVVEEEPGWPEMRLRERFWMSLEEAGARLASHPIGPLFARVIGHLEGTR